MKKASFYTHVVDLWSSRDEPGDSRKLADAYWQALLIVCGLLVLSGAIFAGYKLFTVMSKGIETGPIVPPPSSTLERKDLEATLEIFKARSTRYASFKNAALQISDPSK